MAEQHGAIAARRRVGSHRERRCRKGDSLCGRSVVPSFLARNGGAVQQCVVVWAGEVANSALGTRRTCHCYLIPDTWFLSRLKGSRPPVTLASAPGPKGTGARTASGPRR